MKKTFKRIVAALLVAVMLFGSAPLETLTGLDLGSLFEVEAEASNTYTINSKNVSTTSVNDPGAGACWEYNNRLYNYVWGKRHSSSFSDKDNILRELSDDKLVLNAENLKKYVMSAVPGAVLRVTIKNKIHGDDGIGHSVFIVNIDEKGQGFTFFDRTTDYGCKEWYMTWEKAASYLGQPYIKYIKWPNSTIYSEDEFLAEMNQKNQLTNASATILKDASGVNSKGVYSTPYHIETETPVSVKKGDKVSVLGWIINKHGSLWYRVKYNGQEGWMFENWISKPKEADPTSDITYYLGYNNGNYKERIEDLNRYKKFNHSKNKNDGISVQGTISSPGRKIKSLYAYILKINDDLSVSVVCKYNKTYNSNSITSLTDLDKSMTFKSLKPGKYAFAVFCTLENSKLPRSNAQSLFELINGIKSMFYTVDSGIFYVYDENTSQATISANVKAVNHIATENTIAMVDTSGPLFIKNSKMIVVPPIVPPVEPDDDNTSGDTPTPTPTPTPAPAPTPAVKVYYPGHYRTTTADNLNIRTGPGSSYAKATSAIPKGTEIGITEVSSNGWGKTVYNGATGWVSLNYCTYLGAFAAIQKPGKVTVTYNSDKDFAAGSVINVSWNAINYADAYNAYLKKSNGTVVKTQTGIKGTSTYFTVDDAGSYYVTVAATNSQHIGDESAPTATFNAHGLCTVTFLDWNGRTEIRRVKYGEAATAPLTPTREGHIFKGWDKSFDHVTSDITVKAEYQIIEYSVKFVREVKNSDTGKTEQIVLKNEKVKFGSAATPPSDVEAPEFYVFAGWNTEDYKCVKSSLIVKAVFHWADSSRPIGITGVSATRIIDGYSINLKISSTDETYKTGRIIVSLKTAEGKQIVTTESAAFSLPSGTTGKTLDPFFIPTDEPATVAEVYVIESFGKAIPISDVKKVTINMNDEWSGWTEKEWPDNTYDDKQTRTLYQYRTKSTTTSTSKNLSGWTKYDTKSTSSSGSTYSAVSAINTDAHVRTVTTKTEPVYSTWYRYSHYTNGGYNVNSKKNVTWACAPWKGNTDDGLGPTNIGPHYYESASPLAYQTSTTWNIRKYNAACSHTVSNARYSCQKCLNTWFYNETTFQKQTGTKTKYNYTDTYYTYYFYKWSDWSSWTTTVHTASATKEVNTNLQYRYKLNGLGIENNEGVARVASTVSAGLTENDILLPNLKKFAGKAVILYIYKHGEASDWTGEYIGQQTIDANGNYSFNFKLREEPTEITGDYVVSIGIQGCDDTITVGRIVAPKPEYKVVFKYRSDPADNTSEYVVLDEQIIREGEAAVAPDHIEFEGYRFNGWLTDLSYITEDTMFVEYGKDETEKIITFEADYKPEEYVVVFVDWDNDSLVMKRYKYGENIVAPIIKTAEGYKALWEGLDMENPVVTGDTVITAKHTKKTYEVNFYNYEGEIIDTQTVEYGSTASDVEIGEKDNYIFVDWEYTEDLFENSIVEGDTIYAGEPVVNFYPVYVFDESVEDPVSSLENGTYSEEQTVELTTATEGAVIYYTLDGTDPKTAVNDIDQAEKVFEYTGPITLNRSVTLKYYACAFEKNDSEVMTNYYAINAGQTESEWMLYEDLPEYVTENEDEYEISSATGYRYKEIITSSNYADIASYEAQGWENTGFEYGEWSDWLMEEPDLSGMAYESETMEPEPELEVRYQYTRYKYQDASGAYVYSPTEVSGFDCELETLLLETKLATAGYLSGTTTKYYNYNGEKWFNYGLTEVEIVPDYMMFRYRLKEYTLKKWGAWTLDAPVEGETRENESGTVYKYLIPEMCVVKIDPGHSDFGVETLYYIIEVNEYLTVDEADYTYEGYDFLGFYTDSGFTKYFNYKTTPVSGEMTLYPKYKAHEFAVIFVDYDGTVLLEETVEYGQCASAFEFEEFERDGYVFIGWDYEGLDFVTEDIIATAQYVKESEYCTVSLNYGKYNMMAGNSFQLVATVTPEDTENPNLIWYSTDESVVTVTDEGFVTAVGEGQASIVVETESTGMIDECVIIVASNPSESLCLTYSSTLTLDKENALLRGVTNSVWTASAIKKEFMNEEADMQIVDINGNTLADDAFVGTGSVIKFMNGETVLDEVNIVVTGDMNGDGYVNNRDAAMITRYLVDKETADFCQMVAIDVNGDGFVNNRDASMVSRYLVGKETL